MAKRKYMRHIWLRDEENQQKQFSVKILESDKDYKKYY